MKEEVRKILERPFPEALRRTRKGSFGKKIVYVEVVHYIRRLTEAFGGDWCFEVVQHEILAGEVIVVGKLTAAGITKMAFGGSAITMARETGRPLSIADDLKGAAADSLKKAASLFGIGLELYGDRCEECDPEPAGKAAPQNVRQLRPEKPPAAKPSPPARNGNSTETVLTTRQAVAIRKLGEQLNMCDADLKTMILKTKGVPLDRLSTRAASELISELQASVTTRPGRASAGGTP